MSVGYDKHSLAYQLELDVKMEEEIGTLAYCRSRNDIVMTLHGVPTWQQFINGLQYLDFDPTNPDWLDAPQADTTRLNFTVSDFSIAVWARVDDLSANRMLLCRGLLNTDGWHCAILMDGSFVLYTSQAGANQSTLSFVGEVDVGIWYLLGFSRTGTVVRCYKNGQDVTETEGAHVNPLTSARELHIGIYDNEVGSPFDGGMHRPRVWSRYLEPWEHMQIYNRERQMFP